MNRLPERVGEAMCACVQSPLSWEMSRLDVSILGTVSPVPRPPAVVVAVELNESKLSWVLQSLTAAAQQQQQHRKHTGLRFPWG